MRKIIRHKEIVVVWGNAIKSKRTDESLSARATAKDVRIPHNGFRRSFIGTHQQRIHSAVNCFNDLLVAPDSSFSHSNMVSKP